MTYCPSVQPKRSRFWIVPALGLLFGLALPAGAADSEFPFDHELLLDAEPMRGSKRLPSLEIGPDGRTLIDLWCNQAEGQVIVVEDTITIMTGKRTDRTCPPERLRGDDAMLAALSEVTNWRRNGVTILLIGPKTLRFRIPTN